MAFPFPHDPGGGGLTFPSRLLITAFVLALQRLSFSCPDLQGIRDPEDLSSPLPRASTVLINLLSNPIYLKDLGASGAKFSQSPRRLRVGGVRSSEYEAQLIGRNYL